MRGKEKYEAIQREVSSSRPRYSKCWTDALRNLQEGCKSLTDDAQHRMALAFTNCFLQKTGRETYPCTADAEMSSCTATMSSEAYNTFTEFFTHTQNICFFLQAQVWQDETDHTINRLADNSALVAQQMEDTSVLQSDIIKKQNESIKNQELLLKHGKDLRQTLEESSDDVQKMLEEFKDSTKEQRAMIFEVFDRYEKERSWQHTWPLVMRCQRLKSEQSVNCVFANSYVIKCRHQIAIYEELFSSLFQIECLTLDRDG